jgi:predicted O-methyltransferase YrrM
MRRTAILAAAFVGAALLTHVGFAQQRQGRPAAADGLFALIDADGDGKLSIAEVDAAPAKLRLRDSNEDGTLTPDELPPPAAGRGQRGGGAEPAPDLQKPPVPRDDAEKTLLDAIETMRQGPRFANVSTADGRLMRMLAESVNAQRIVELGTSTGESGVWWAMALRKTGGHLYTHDLDPERIKVARANFEKAGVSDLITIIEGDAHETVKQHKDPIDILFIDADKPGYLDYLKQLLPLVRPGGLILAHNMHRPAPSPDYVETITNDPNLDTSFLLMDAQGMGVTLKKR